MSIKAHWNRRSPNSWIEIQVKFNWFQKLQVLFKREVTIRFENCNIVDLRKRGEE